MGLTYKIESIEQKILDKVECDRCGVEIEKVSESGWNPYGEPFTFFHPPHFKEYFLVRKAWGYFSPKDGQRHEAVLCEKCYDEVFEGVKIKIDDYFEGKGDPELA